MYERRPCTKAKRSSLREKKNEYTSRWYRTEKFIRRLVGHEAGNVEEWIRWKRAPYAMLEYELDNAGFRELEKGVKQLKIILRWMF